MHAPRRFLTALTFLLAFGAIAGCKVTGEDIEYWKGTVKGPGKIVAVILTDRYPMELRTQGALALVEMERTDVDGIELLQQALGRLQSTHPDDVGAIIDGMVPGLLEMVTGGDDANADPNLGPPPQQVRAKDASYLMITHASPDARQQLVAAVVGWYAVDFANRSLSGNFSVEQVVRSLGAPAARQLVEAMNSHVPQQALVKIAELIGQIGDEATKNLAGERLVAIEQEMEGDEFVTWLGSKIRESLEEQGREASDTTVNNIAVVNREAFILTGALPAMKHLSNTEAVRNRLMAVASGAPAADAPDGAKIAINDRRAAALVALEGSVGEAQLEAILAIALDETNPVNLRDNAFDRVGDIRSAAAVPRLWPLVMSASNDELPKRLRWRAGELVLALGGSEVVTEFLTKLPTDEGVQFEPAELEGYAARMSQMTPPPVALVEGQLASPQWFKRVIALQFIARRGSEADVAKMQRLSSDPAPVVGPSWARREITTVGQSAEAAIASLRERLAEADGDAPAAAGGE